MLPFMNLSYKDKKLPVIAASASRQQANVDLLYSVSPSTYSRFTYPGILLISPVKIQLSFIIAASPEKVSRSD